MSNLPDEERLPEKLHKRMKYIAMMSESHGGMYPGDWWELAAKQYTRLEQLGYVEQYHPHNPVHKTRAVITNAGRTYLERFK